MLKMNSIDIYLESIFSELKFIIKNIVFQTGFFCSHSVEIYIILSQCLLTVSISQMGAIRRMKIRRSHMI